MGGGGGTYFPIPPVDDAHDYITDQNWKDPLGSWGIGREENSLITILESRQALLGIMGFWESRIT